MLCVLRGQQLVLFKASIIVTKVSQQKECIRVVAEYIVIRSLVSMAWVGLFGHLHGWLCVLSK